jgi:hypothetical protein
LSERPWLLVVGAHRSGTSAVTGAMGALGFTVPSLEDRMDWPDSNPEHWESLSLSIFNEDLLFRLGGGWDGPPELGKGWEHGPAMDGLADPTELLGSAFLGNGPPVWKDPRVCLLLDYWRQVLDGPLAAVLVWRAPVAVARSLERRDGMGITDGLALWERYNRAALQGLDGVDTFVVGYESFLDDAEGVVGRMAGWLGSLDQFVALTGAWEPAKAAASIDQALQHQKADDTSGGGIVLTPQQQELVDRLAAADGGHRPLQPGAPLPESPVSTEVLRVRREISRLRRELDRREDLAARLTATETNLEHTRGELQDAYGYLASTEEALAEAQRTIESMRESTSWRMTKPVRSVISFRQGLGSRPDSTT